MITNEPVYEWHVEFVDGLKMTVPGAHIHDALHAACAARKKYKGRVLTDRESSFKAGGYRRGREVF